jgi:uncharacterized membrane protein HdeD (DUF308 family)
LGEAAWIAPLSGVNESTWEHMKLLFWSMFLFSIVQSFFFKDRKDFWYVKLKGILLGLALIPIIFYTYNGAIGKSPSWFNIAIFFITTAIVYIYETKEFNKNKMKFISPKLAISLLSAIALLFVAFTFKTPELEIFRDPVSGGYGI